MKTLSSLALRLLAGVLIASLVSVRAQNAAALGFDPARLARLDAVVEDYIARGQLAGGIVCVTRDGQVAHFKAYGHQDIEAGKPMPTDAIFRIASMSKAVTTIAVMMLYEEGRFMLGDPISNYIPASRILWSRCRPCRALLPAPSTRRSRSGGRSKSATC